MTSNSQGLLRAHRPTVWTAVTLALAVNLAQAASAQAESAAVAAATPAAQASVPPAFFPRELKTVTAADLAAQAAKLEAAAREAQAAQTAIAAPKARAPSAEQPRSDAADAAALKVRQREVFVARMTKRVTDTQALVGRLFAGKIPAKAELAKLTDARLAAVKALEPQLPTTAERRERDERITALTLQLHIARQASIVRTDTPSAKADKAPIGDTSSGEYFKLNDELVALTTARSKDFADHASSKPSYEAANAELLDYLQVSELEDSERLLAGAKVQLDTDRADLAASQATSKK